MTKRAKDRTIQNRAAGPRKKREEHIRNPDEAQIQPKLSHKGGPEASEEVLLGPESKKHVKNYLKKRGTMVKETRGAQKSPPKTMLCRLPRKPVTGVGSEKDFRGESRCQKQLPEGRGSDKTWWLRKEHLVTQARRGQVRHISHTNDNWKEQADLLKPL